MEKSEKNIPVVVAPRSAANQILGLYLIVSFLLALSWLLGTWSFSFLWIFGMIFGLFLVWKTRLKNVVERNLDWHKENYHRKRALRQEETAEWLNFVINRWWVFSSVSIEDLVRRRINDRLLTVKPSFIDALELSGFTFGDITPSVRNVKAFECSDGVRGFKPASWSNISQPPVGLDKLSEHRIVLEANMASRCNDFRMVFRARKAIGKVGLDFDMAVEELQLKGTIQIVLHMSMEVPFPHVTKATVSFTDLPEVWFNVKVLKALTLTEIPLLKSWIHINVMEGITKALVDPGQITIPIVKVGPVNARNFVPKKKQLLGEGVLTIQLKGTPGREAGEDICYTRLRVGSSKRQTVEVSASHTWEDCCSFFVYDLAREKLNIKYKCKRLLTTVTLEQHDLDLSSFPFQVTKLVNHEIENKDGSKLSLQMDYSPLPVISLDEEEPVNVLQRSGVVYVCVHCANNVIASDKTGSSDPYCVVFCERRRVLTTSYISQTRNPSWESQTEFFVKDFTQCNLSFYVFDWDGTNTIDDDFLGSANFSMSEKRPCVLREMLALGYNKQGEGHVGDLSLGQITVSIIFRPVPSVGRSEKYRLLSADSVNNNNNEFLYVEDMVSPGTMPVLHQSQCTTEDNMQAISKRKRSKQIKGGGRKLSKVHSSVPVSETDLLQDKIFVDLTIIQAKDLIPMDRNGYSDPFCEVKMNGVKLFCTSVKKKTLFPKWNETVTFQVSQDNGMLELHLYDKDMFVNDFLGKLVLTLDQLKEISLKGSSEWFPLQHTHSGQLQLKCSVMDKDTVKRKSTCTSETELVSAPNIGLRQSNPAYDSSKSSSKRDSILENDVFITAQTNTQDVKQSPPDQGNGDAGHVMESKPATQTMPRTSTPLKDGPDGVLKHRRSTSDINMERKSRSNSLNSFAVLHDMDISTECGNLEVHGTSPTDREEDDAHSDRLYNVMGKVMSIQGLKFSEGSIYVKVRAMSPYKHRLRQIFGHRVIARSPMVRASQPIFNVPFDIDKGMGISGDTLIKFDVKREGKEHLATKAFTLKSLFSGPGGEGDKIQKVLPLENNLQLEVYLQHSPQDSKFLKRRSGGKLSPTSKSFRL